MSKRGDYWKSLGFTLTANGAWYGVNEAEKRFVVCAPEEYRTEYAQLCLAPKFVRHGRMAESRYQSAVDALDKAIVNNFDFFTVATRFYNSGRNRKARSNRVWEYSTHLMPVKMMKKKRKFFAVPIGFLNRLNSENNADDGYLEGTSTSVILKGRERSREARAEAIAIHGLSCKACDMNFEDRYGELGKGYIHIHHLTPFEREDGPRRTKPKDDLVPLCPNCHAMVHRGKELLSIEALRDILAGRRPK